MIRPGTAHPSRISQILRGRQRRVTFNQSKNSIAPAFHEQAKEENVEEAKEEANEVRSQNPQGLNQEGSKVNLAIMLMKFQLNKMGFGKKQYQRLIENFVKETDLNEIKFSNLKQWVLTKRSHLVELLLKQDKEKLHEIRKSERSESRHARVAPMEVSRIEIHEKQKMSQSSLSQPQFKPKIQLKMEQNSSKQRILKEIPINPIVCPICLIETQDYVRRKCGHIFCKECVRSYFIENIASGNYIIDCPELDCDQKMGEDEGVLVLNEQQYNRFVRFKHKTALENDPNNKFCNRPDCGELLAEMKDKKLFCKTCNIIFCPMCQEPLHPNKQCGEVLQQEMDKTYKDLKIKKCPKCSSPIQKIDGCNHMTCKKCKEQFCWICLGPYTPYHYRIYNCCGCPGLQFDEAEEIGFKRFLQILFFVFLPVILGVAIASIFLMLPLFMLYDLITKPCRWISSTFDSYSDKKCEIAILQTLCCFLPDCFIAFFCYFALLPRAALYCAFISPVEYTGIIINILCNIV